MLWIDTQVETLTNKLCKFVKVQPIFDLFVDVDCPPGVVTVNYGLWLFTVPVWDFGAEFCILERKLYDKKKFFQQAKI